MNKQTIFENAIIKNKPEIVKGFINDPDIVMLSADMEALQLACELGHIEIIKLLLNDPRCKVEHRNDYALYIAASRGYFDIVKLLVGNPLCTPENYDNDAIHGAYKGKHYEVVNFLFNIPSVKKSLKSDRDPLYKELISKNIQEKVNLF